MTEDKIIEPIEEHGEDDGFFYYVAYKIPMNIDKGMMLIGPYRSEKAVLSYADRLVLEGKVIHKIIKGQELNFKKRSSIYLDKEGME